MNANELSKQIIFGLENLERIRNTILHFVKMEVDKNIKTSALVYECIGYYNAVEHLMIRFLKSYGKGVPSGSSSHKDTINAFRDLINKKGLNSEILDIIKEMMAFRHVATKIYGFLISWEKLQFIVQHVQNYHEPIKNLFLNLIHDAHE